MYGLFIIIVNFSVDLDKEFIFTVNRIAYKESFPLEINLFTQQEPIEISKDLTDYMNPNYTTALLEVLPDTYKLDQKIYIHTHKQLALCTQKFSYVNKDIPPTADAIDPNFVDMIETKLDHPRRKVKCQRKKNTYFLKLIM